MPQVTGLNTNFDNQKSATIYRYVGRKYANHVASHHPFLMKLFQNGNVVKGHGYKYVIPFRYPSPVGPSPAGVADDFTPIARPVEMGGFSDFEFTPAMFAMNIGLGKYDLAAQGEKTELINWKQSRMEQGMDHFDEFFNTGFWGAEGASGAGGSRKDVLTSMRALVNGGGASTTGGGWVAAKANQLTAAVGTSPLTLVAGVERNQAGGAYVCPNLYNPTTPATPSIQLLDQVHLSTSLNGEKADLIMADEALYSYYSVVAASEQRFGESELAKMGFDAIRYKNAEIIFDDLMPTGTNAHQIFCLNTKHFMLKYNTMKPVFERADYPDMTLENYQGTQILQLCADHLGRKHARHAKIADVS